MIDEKKLLKDLDSEIRLSIGNNTEVRKVLSQITDVVHRQPQIQLEYETGKMTVEINKDFETILLCAVRYAIGRRTYIPSLVIDYITPLLPYLSDNTLRLIANEITEYEAHEGGLGDEKIDRPYWEQFLRKIRLEMGGRGMTELKKCPFCGSKARIKTCSGKYFVKCTHETWCEVFPKTWLYNTKKEAIEAWNRRAE